MVGNGREFRPAERGGLGPTPLRRAEATEEWRRPEEEKGRWERTSESEQRERRDWKSE